MKNAETFAIPAELVRWIGEHMAAAPDLGRVRVFRGPSIPFDWLPGNRKRYIGITLWNRVWLREPFELDAPSAYELLFHELVHVRQFAASPVGFPLRYLFYLMVKGYWAHPAEIEARAVAGAMREAYFRGK